MDTAVVPSMEIDKAVVPPVSVACRDLSVTIGKKTLLHRVNLLAEPGQFLVVAGPSGAGKTTLLNNVAFRTKTGRRNGQVLLNGHLGDAKGFRQVGNYVMTNGRLLPYLTVYETLMTSARLKLPDLTHQERQERVETVLTELGLRKCRNTYVGGEWKKGISTGEKKRVCIAIELLSQPSVLVLDEPTSGLDSTLACELLMILKRLASSGRTVICSIHQPTSAAWGLFDRFLLLSNGNVAYHGKAEDAKAYFSQRGFECPKNYNPADFFLNIIADADDDFPDATSRGSATAMAFSEQGDLESPESESTGIERDSRKLLDAFADSKEHEALTKSIDALIVNPGENKVLRQRQGPRQVARSALQEIRALSARSFKNAIRNPIVCCVLLVVQALQGIILGGIFWQLTSDVANQTPFSLDTKAIVENDWARVFINGIDGQQPLLDALEEGVDGQGSQPLFTLLEDRESLEWLREVTTCAARNYALQQQNYPDFGVRGIEFPRPEGDTGGPFGNFVPGETAGNVIALLQMADFGYMRVDWTNTIQVPSIWWGNLIAKAGCDFLDVFFGCAGYPKLDTCPAASSLVQRDFFAPRINAAEEEGAAPKRNLITIGETGIEDAMLDLMGIGASDFVTAIGEILDRITACDNAACVWLGETYNSALNFFDDSYTAVMAVINILGALYFATANLGFSTYDALLTFPQERPLFNREMANGDYRASTYFFAKNMADLPFQLIPSFVLVTIYYFFIGIGGTVGQYFIYMIACMGITFAAYGFGYLISAASPRMEIAVLTAPVILVIWLTIAGFLLPDDLIPKWIKWFSYISFYRWGFFALVANQFRADGSFGLMSNKIPLLLSGVKDNPLWLSVVLVYVLGIGYRFLAYLALKYTNRKVGLQV